MIGLRRLLLAAGCFGVAGLCAAYLISWPRGTSRSRATVDASTSRSAPPSYVAELPSSFAFADAIQIPGTDRVLLTDGRTGGQLFLWTVGAYGQPDGEITPLGVTDAVRLAGDAAVTTDGWFVFAMSSMGRQGGSRQMVFTRLRVNEHRLELDGNVTVFDAPFEWLLRLVDPRRDGVAADGLEIQGVAWDPRRQRFLLALYPSLGSGSPLVVPFRLTGSSSALHVEWDGEPILIPGIVGNAIRSLQYDAELRTLIILTAGQDEREPSAKAFAVWRWSGASHEPAVRLVDFGPRIGDREIAPAGICRVTLPGGDSYLLVVSDRAPFYWKFRVGRQP